MKLMGPQFLSEDPESVRFLYALSSKLNTKLWDASSNQTHNLVLNSVDSRVRITLVNRLIRNLDETLSSDIRSHYE